MNRTIRRTMPHPRVPIGWVNGRPVFPILGASEDDPSNDDTQDGQDEPDGSDAQDAPPVDDALAAQKKVNRDLERKLREARRELDALRAKPDSGQEPPPVDEIVAQRVSEALAEQQAKAAQRVLRSEVKAAAAGRMADPQDALVHLDLGEFAVDEDGSVDEQAIADAIDELLSKKPYLAAQGGSRGSADGGPREESSSEPKTVEAWNEVLGRRH